MIADTQGEGATFVYKRASLYPKQEAAMFDVRRYSLIEATTKAGKTSSAIVWIGEQAFKGRRGDHCWWVAPIFSQAKIAFDRMCRALPRSVIAGAPNMTELRITLINGVTIWFKGADKPDSLYGEDVIAAVIDEASRVKEAAWHAVRSTLTATRGLIRMIGNVRGRKNWFFKLCRKAESGEPNMGYHKITWKDAVAAGILEMAEIDDARAQLPPSVFRELYEADPADDEGNPFGGPEVIGKCVIPEFSVYPIAVWGWDLAKHHDWTVGTALDRKGREVKRVRFQSPWRDTKARIVRETAARPALIDATGVGDPILEDLQASGGNFEGYVFTSRSKQMLMEGLAIAIQHGEIGLTEGVTINELESFEYEYTASGIRYSAPEGCFDDCVCSVALAVRHLGPRTATFQGGRVGAPADSEDAVDGSGPAQWDDAETRVGLSWENHTPLI